MATNYNDVPEQQNFLFLIDVFTAFVRVNGYIDGPELLKEILTANKTTLQHAAYFKDYANEPFNVDNVIQAYQTELVPWLERKGIWK